jgi:hypothetical protein
MNAFNNDEQPQQQEWNQLPDESDLWFSRFTRFRLMQPVRKIPLVFQQEQAEENRGKQRNLRTDPPGEWYEIAKKWRWRERAAAWDAQSNADLEELIAAERAQIIKRGFALQHKRIQALDAMATHLLKEFSQKDKLWLPDVKAIGVGKDQERVDLITFNDALVRELRGCFADLASEMGERVKKTEATLKDFPKVYINMPDDTGLPDELEGEEGEGEHVPPPEPRQGIAQDKGDDDDKGEGEVNVEDLV